MEFLFGLLSFMVFMVYGQDDGTVPIVNNAPKASPDDNYRSWFEHKYIASTFNDHMMLIIGISAAIFITLAICVIYKCRKSSAYSGYAKQKRFNDDTDYETDIETLPFNYK